MWMDFNEIDWSKVIFGGLTASVGKFLWDGLKFFKGLKRVKKSEAYFVQSVNKSVRSIILNSILIYELLQEYAKNTSTANLLIIKLTTNNNDKIIDAQGIHLDTELSVLYEASSDNINMRNIKQDFQNYSISHQHKKLILRMIEEGELEVDPLTTDVKIIKQLAEADGIQMKYMRLIKCIPNVGVFYLVSHNKVLLSFGQTYKLAILVRKLATLFDEMFTSSDKIVKINH